MTHRQLAIDHHVSLRDDMRFWMVEPGPPPWFSPSGKERKSALRNLSVKERAEQQKAALEQAAKKEQEEDDYFWSPPPKD